MPHPGALAPEAYQDSQIQAGQPDQLGQSGQLSRSGQQTVPQPQGSTSPEAEVPRETMAPPRRRVSAQQQAPQAQNAPAADDLSSERLRSVAPSVPGPRRVPEASAQDLPTMPPRAAQPGPAQSVQAAAPAQQPEQFEEPAHDADELVVPWQSVAQPAAEGFGAAQGTPRGTRRRAETSVDEVLPEPVSAPQPVLLDPEPGEEDFAPQSASGVYEPEFQDEANDDPLSGSGTHARQQQSQAEAQHQQPESGAAVRRPAAKTKEPAATPNPAIRRPGTQAPRQQPNQDLATQQQAEATQSQVQAQGQSAQQQSQAAQSHAPQPQPVQKQARDSQSQAQVPQSVQQQPQDAQSQARASQQPVQQQPQDGQPQVHAPQQPVLHQSQDTQSQGRAPRQSGQPQPQDAQSQVHAPQQPVRQQSQDTQSQGSAPMQPVQQQPQAAQPQVHAIQQQGHDARSQARASQQPVQPQSQEAQPLSQVPQSQPVQQQPQVHTQQPPQVQSPPKAQAKVPQQQPESAESRVQGQSAAPAADRRSVPGSASKAVPAKSAAPGVAARPARPRTRPTEVPAAAVVPGDTDGSRAPGYGDDALEAVYRVIHERRDIRNDFLVDEVPTEVLTRILEAAHTAPSVGFSQPWDFLVLRDEERRRAVHDLAARQRKAYAASLPKARAKAFAALKIEAILDTPVNIVVTCDPTRGGRHTLGRYTQPMMAPFSTCLAVENLWLAARAEGLGVGWVSFFDERELAETLGLPEHLQIVAYLCIGYVKRFPAEPELVGSGWARRRPLSWAVHEEDYGRRALPGGAPVSLLDATVDAVRGLDESAVAAARDRQGRMTKPPGSLGMLEHVAEQLAGLSGQCPPPLPEPAALAVFAADHGVHAQGVTPWPQEVTAQMVANFLAGGAVVNAFAKQVGAEVCVVDVGVNANLGNAAGLVPRKVRFGTADMTQGPAMSRDEALAAIEAGIETARDLVAAGNRCLLTGDMGIANTTASAALIAAFTGASPAQVTGYGTGIDEQTYAHKVEIVRRALELHRPDPQDPVGVLAAFGGLEHAALAGFILGGSALRIPVVLDGVIAGAAALVAQAIAPEVTAACVAGHRSAEPGHALALEALGVNPLIDLELRLGEGSGAVLALPLVASAVRALREVATFDSAGVADASSAAVAPAARGRES